MAAASPSFRLRLAPRRPVRGNEGHDTYALARLDMMGGTSDFAQIVALRWCRGRSLYDVGLDRGAEAETVMAEVTGREEGSDAAEVRLNRLLNVILESAVELLGIDGATVSARQGEDVATIAATDQRMIALDDAQYATGEGPCMVVLEPRGPLFLEDVSATEDRWQQFAQDGVASGRALDAVCAPEGLSASLNLYSRRRTRGPRSSCERRRRTPTNWRRRCCAWTRIARPPS